jgi:hypothetical protein
MFNVKSRKLVLTLFCSLALVLVLTDGASANAQLDGHRMLRKRLPEVLGRADLADIINVGTTGDSGNPNQGNNPGGSVSSVSNPVSTNLSSFRAAVINTRFPCSLALDHIFVLVTAIFGFALLLNPPVAVLFPELQFQSELLVELLLIEPHFHLHPTPFHSHSRK